MSPDDYVRLVLSSYDLPSGESSPAELAALELRPSITEWAGRFLLGIGFCGSYANGTRVKGATDIDILVSLGPRTPLDADKLYDSAILVDKTGKLLLKHGKIDVLA